MGNGQYKNSTATFSSTLDYLSRGFGYWLVSLLALLAGVAYFSQSVFTVNMLKLGMLSILTYPFFVVYSLVYDVPELGETSTSTISEAHRSLIEKSRRNAQLFSWVLSGLGAVLAWLALVQIENLSIGWEHFLTFIATQKIRALYLAVVVFLYWQYTYWLYNHRKDKAIILVRYEVFLPVLVCVCLNYYTGVHLLKEDFSWSEILVPSSLYLWYLSIHLVHNKTKLVTPRLFASVTVISFLIVFVAYLVASRTSTPPSVISLLSDLLLASLLALYLSTFELWRTTSLIEQLGDRAELMGFEMPGELNIGEMRSRYFRATLSAQAIALVGSPLIFLVGDRLGAIFLFGTLIHAFVGLMRWYNRGDNPALRPETWRVYKVAFGFAYFSVLLVDVIWNVPVTVNFIPNFSGLVPTLVGGSFFAVVALPVRRFLKRFGATGSPSQFFYALHDKRDVFELAASVAVLVFAITFIIYNVTPAESHDLKYKSSVVCAVSYLLAVAFSLFVNYRWLFHERLASDEGTETEQQETGKV